MRQGKLEFWYFDYGAATVYSVIQYPDEVAAATAQLSTNAAGFARVTIRPLLTAEEMDKAVEKWPPHPRSAAPIDPAGHRSRSPERGSGNGRLVVSVIRLNGAGDKPRLVAVALLRGGSGRLRDPRLAGFVPWDSIGASRRLDDFLIWSLKPREQSRGFLCPSAVFGAAPSAEPRQLGVKLVRHSPIIRTCT